MKLLKLKTEFLIPILSIIGFIANLLSIIIFSLIIKNEQRDDMYKYLLLKSICEMLGCLFSVLNQLRYYFTILLNTYIMVVWSIWFEEYIIKALFMASTGYEIAATFNCAISIEKRMKWCQKRVSFWLWVIFILILSFGVEIFPVFMVFIRKLHFTDQFNRTIYVYDMRLPSSSVLKLSSFYFSRSLIEDVMFLFILLSINIYILVKLIQIGRRKKRLTSKNSNIQNSNRAENRKIMMIIVLFLTFLLGHLPRFLTFAFIRTGSFQFWLDFSNYGDIFLYFSYSTSFFVYFAFNNNFKNLFLKIIHFRYFN
jgi:hypothetical protein